MTDDLARRSGAVFRIKANLPLEAGLEWAAGLTGSVKVNTDPNHPYDLDFLPTDESYSEFSVNNDEVERNDL